MVKLRGGISRAVKNNLFILVSAPYGSGKLFLTELTLKSMGVDWMYISVSYLDSFDMNSAVHSREKCVIIDEIDKISPDNIPEVVKYLSSMRDCWPPRSVIGMSFSSDIHPSIKSFFAEEIVIL